MKVAFYMDRGVEQIVFTPEDDFEKSMLGLLQRADRVVEIKKGTFYPTRGGWIRHEDDGSSDSTMLVMQRATSEPLPGAS